jgi:adenine phosphoribosyltransferase
LDAAAEIARLIRTIPDHPKPGIQFRDITTLIADPRGLQASIELLAATYQRGGQPQPEVVVGIEARGFIFGAAVAVRLGVGFVPLRKPGKLPGNTVGQDFALEYGEDRIEVHVDAIASGMRALVVDDLIATGGTAEAGVELIRSQGGVVDDCAFVVSLPDLGGRSRLETLGCRVFSLCEFEGE